MSIRPVDMNGVIQRTQDVGTLKQHQDMKPMVDQQNIQIEVQREEYRQSEQVTRKDDSQMEKYFPLNSFRDSSTRGQILQSSV